MHISPMLKKRGTLLISYSYLATQLQLYLTDYKKYGFGQEVFFSLTKPHLCHYWGKRILVGFCHDDGGDDYFVLMKMEMESFS